MPSKPPPEPRRPKLLQLTDADLKALGEVAAQWSLASAILEILLLVLSRSNPEFHTLTKDRLISFDNRADACKTALKTFSQFPLHREIGLALMARGKELSTERNIALHWPASRLGLAADGPIQFADLDMRATKPHKRTWTNKRLLQLADNIADWTMDIGQFKMRLILDGPLGLLPTFHGPGIGMGTLQWESFHTVRKAPRPAKPRKP